MRPSHSFPTDTDPLLAIAHDIVLRGPTVAITRQLTAIEANDLRNAAQRYIDTDGDDDGDLAYMLAEIDAWLNSPGYGPGDIDWRGSRAAETHFGGRYAA